MYNFIYFMQYIHLIYSNAITYIKLFEDKRKELYPLLHASAIWCSLIYSYAKMIAFQKLYDELAIKVVLAKPCVVALKEGK